MIKIVIVGYVVSAEKFYLSYYTKYFIDYFKNYTWQLNP